MLVSAPTRRLSPAEHANRGSRHRRNLARDPRRRGRRRRGPAASAPVWRLTNGWLEKHPGSEGTSSCRCLAWALAGCTSARRARCEDREGGRVHDQVLEDHMPPRTATVATLTHHAVPEKLNRAHCPRPRELRGALRRRAPGTIREGRVLTGEEVRSPRGQDLTEETLPAGPDVMAAELYLAPALARDYNPVDRDAGLVSEDHHRGAENGRRWRLEYIYYCVAGLPTSCSRPRSRLPARMASLSRASRSLPRREAGTWFLPARRAKRRARPDADRPTRCRAEKGAGWGSSTSLRQTPTSPARAQRPSDAAPRRGPTPRPTASPKEAVARSTRTRLPTKLADYEDSDCQRERRGSPTISRRDRRVTRRSAAEIPLGGAPRR